MPGIDTMISEHFSDELKKKLNEKTLKKFERVLFTKYGFSIKQSIEEFQKFDITLNEFLGPKSKNFEIGILKKVLTITDLSDKKHFLVTIKNKKLSDFIIKMCSDKEILKIFKTTFPKDLTISEILDIVKISKTSGYRKISLLVRKGFLVKTGTILSKSKKVGIYRKLFGKITIGINEENINVKVKIPRGLLLDSSVIKQTEIKL